ncbi:MAG: hypothetical protein HYZ73_05310 [Elusimicrobia bacterium]|nr:hypothetical protein [Elusimicrobiota bacterium]
MNPYAIPPMIASLVSGLAGAFILREEGGDAIENLLEQHTLLAPGAYQGCDPPLSTSCEQGTDYSETAREAGRPKTLKSILGATGLGLEEFIEQL